MLLKITCLNMYIFSLILKFIEILKAHRHSVVDSIDNQKKIYNMNCHCTTYYVQYKISSYLNYLIECQQTIDNHDILNDDKIHDVFIQLFYCNSFTRDHRTINL